MKVTNIIIGEVEAYLISHHIEYTKGMHGIGHRITEYVTQ